jgi:hypothetical protein
MGTFGHSPGSGGASTEPLSDDYTVVFGPYTLPVAAVINSISVWLLQSPDAGAFDIRCCIYADSAGSPGALAGQTIAQHLTSFASPGYVTFTFSADPSLPSGSYWLGIQVGNHTNTIGQYTYDTGTRKYKARAYASGPQDPFGTADATDTHQGAIYATYTDATPAPPYANVTITA